MSKETTMEALLDSLTQEELDALAVMRSYDWCGTDWENQEMSRIKRILEARNRIDPDWDPVMKQHPLKKLFSFLSS